jgi:ring-1,2-phenylacetyl-CoA epoxidase subunit PaaC
MDPDTDDNPYLALAEVGDDARWAFGGGFDDPLEGVDTRVPPGVDAGALATVCVCLGDESLLLAQTLQRWCTHAPELEEEVAVANVALDLIGQTRLLYARAAAAVPALVPDLPDGSVVPAEDRLAFFRDASDFRVAALAVMPDADFAGLMLRLAAVATWRDALWQELRTAPDPVLAAVAGRAVAEVGYHRELAARWVTVLAHGTEESAGRLAAACRQVLPHVPALARPPADVAGDPVWSEAWARAGRQFDASWSAVEQRCGEVMVSTGSTDGVSTGSTDPAEWRAELVQEMQSVARQHPMGRW